MALLNRHVFKPATAKAIERMGPIAERVADRWAGGWPKATRDMDRTGRLVHAVKTQAKREAEIYSDARVGGKNSHLADHEIAEMYDLSPGPPA